MSKSSELRMMKYGLRIDAPVNFHHRTGDSDEGGSMLDFYARSESAEEIYFGNADELARERFVKGFQVYLKKVFSAQEREFLKRLLAGKESAYKIGRSLGVEHFAFLQSIQLKAYKNIKPLAKLAKMTGWSGAESFTETIFKRLEQLNAGFSINEIIPQNRKIEKLRAKKNAIMRRWREKNHEHLRAAQRAYYKANRERRRAYLSQPCVKERRNAMQRAWREKNRERELAKRREYQASNREHLRAMGRAWRKANREKVRKEEKDYYLKSREKIRAKQKAYYKANRERMRAYMSQPCVKERRNAMQRARRARKKAEREEAKKAVLAQVGV